MAKPDGESKESDGREGIRLRALVQDFMSAAKEGDIEHVQKTIHQLKEQHLDLTAADIIRDTKEGNGRTALHFAAAGGNVELVRCLLNIAPDGANWLDDQGDTPLALAVSASRPDSTGNIEVVKTFLAAGASANGGGKEGKAAPIHHAAGHGDVEMIKLLAQEGADVNMPSEGGTPLHWAAGEGKINAVEALIELGAELDSKDSRGLSPLIMAAAHGCESSVVTLVKAGADTGFILAGGLTVLHMMAEHGSTEAVKAIVATEGGKKLAVFSGDHGKPIDLAALEGFREIVEVLREYSDIGDLSVDEIMAEGKRKQVEQQEAREAQSKEDDSSFPAGMKKISLEDIPPPKSHEDIDSANQLKEQANKLFAKGDFLGALKLYDEAVSLNGLEAVFYSNRSACYMELGEPEKALEQAQIALMIRPNWSKAVYRISVAYMALKRYEDAAVAALGGLNLDQENAALRKILDTSVEILRKEHQANSKQQDL